MEPNENQVDPEFIYTDIIACDFSFRRPGFALLRYNKNKHTVRI